MLFSSPAIVGMLLGRIATAMLLLCGDEDFSWRHKDFIKNSQQTYLRSGFVWKREKCLLLI